MKKQIALFFNGTRRGPIFLGLEALLETLTDSGYKTELVQDITALTKFQLVIISDIYQTSIIKQRYPGLPVLFLPDSPINPVYPPSTQFDPDYICSWSSAQANDFKEKFPSSKVYVTGHPTLDLIKSLHIEPPTSQNTGDIRTALLLIKEESLQGCILKYVKFLKNINTISEPDCFKKGFEGLKAIKTADYIITNQLDYFLYSILLGKVPVLIETQDSLAIKPLKEMGGAIVIKDMLEVASILQAQPKKQDLTPQQMNFYLLNYLPCTLDSSNMKRIGLVIALQFQLTEALSSVEANILTKFEQRFPKLIDPLVEQKEMALKYLETGGIEP